MNKKPVFEENFESEILCPNCIQPPKLIVKTNRKTGSQFLGCPNFPECNYTHEIPEAWIMRAQGQPALF
jgi:ssDNA-binding Zn-finger/Zn-ribbon topoisomerase 1